VIVALAPVDREIAAGQRDRNLTAGTAQSPGLFLARLDSSGALDTTFGTAGFADAPVANVRPWTLLLRPDNTIVVVGDHFSGGTNYEYLVAQYSADGIVDTNFGTNGYVTTAFSTLAIPTTGILQQDGSTVVAGHTFAPSDSGNRYQIALARYTTAGVLDNTFGTAGTTLTDLGGSLGAVGVVRQSNGNFILAVANTEGLTEDFMTFRYTPDGNYDTTWGNNGVLRTDFQGGPDYASAISLEPNDGFIISGTSAPLFDGGAGASEIALLRYTASGAVDTTFGSAGKILVPLAAQTLATTNGHVKTATSIVLAASGKITVDGGTADRADLLHICF